MGGHIPSQFIDELLNRADIVTVIDARVPLKKQGREYVACCPFHNEKTPSFTVSQAKQFYHCFGCGSHGSAIGFLMSYEHLEFRDAVEELAAEVGMQIPRQAERSEAPRIDAGLYEVLESAAGFYRKQLRDAVASKVAIDYLKSRGVSGEIAAEFGIGFAPQGWDNLGSALRNQGVTEKTMAAAGLVINKEGGGYYDRFRQRIMFPIRDRRGRVIAFGGRALGDENPKYLNSPETAVFHKGRELYGLYEARKATTSLDTLLVVEGYMDVVSLVQFGVRNAVATLGTATTADHLKLLFRACNTVVFCFDGDRAGREAAWRALQVTLPLMNEGRQVGFMFLPEGEDPDSMVRKEGRQAFELRIKDAMPFSQFFYENLSRGLSLHTLDARSGLVEKVRPLLREIPAGSFREMMLEKLSTISQMDSEKLAKLVVSDKPASQHLNLLVPSIKSTPVRHILRLLLRDPSLALTVDIDALNRLDFPGIELLRNLIMLIKETPSMTAGVLMERCRERPEAVHLQKLLSQPMVIPEDGMAQEFQDAVQRLINLDVEQRIDELLTKASREPLSKAESDELRNGLAKKSAGTIAPSN